MNANETIFGIFEIFLTVKYHQNFKYIKSDKYEYKILSIYMLVFFHFVYINFNFA